MNDLYFELQQYADDDDKDSKVSGLTSVRSS